MRKVIDMESEKNKFLEDAKEYPLKSKDGYVFVPTSKGVKKVKVEKEEK